MAIPLTEVRVVVPERVAPLGLTSSIKMGIFALSMSRPLKSWTPTRIAPKLWPAAREGFVRKTSLPWTLGLAVVVAGFVNTKSY